MFACFLLLRLLWCAEDHRPLHRPEHTVAVWTTSLIMQIFRLTPGFSRTCVLLQTTFCIQHDRQDTNHWFVEHTAVLLVQLSDLREEKIMFQLNHVPDVSFKNSCLRCHRQDWKSPLFFGLLAASEQRNVVKKSEQRVGFLWGWRTLCADGTVSSGELRAARAGKHFTRRQL